MAARHEAVKWKDNHRSHKGLLARFKLTSDSKVWCCAPVKTNVCDDFTGAELGPLTGYLLADVH